MPFQKGRPKTGGRKPGTPNKATASTKAALHEAFARLGGVPSLVAWARKNRTEFYRLWGRTLPTELKNADGETLRVVAFDYAVLFRPPDEAADPVEAAIEAEERKALPAGEGK